MSLTILFEDEHILVVSKPAGLSTQAPPIAGTTLETMVRRYLGNDDPAAAFAGTVHRLDRPVSGVVLWAKTPRDAHRLARQFERRVVRKEYTAIVQGSLPATRQGVWVDWLVRENTGLGRVQRCRPHTPRSQEARTRFELLELDRGPGPPLDEAVRSYLALLNPETGRMHQLRVQCAERALPIVGDALYGSQQSFEPDAIALHARRLTFRHPRDESAMTIEAPFPPVWLKRGWVLPER